MANHTARRARQVEAAQAATREACATIPKGHSWSSTQGWTRKDNEQDKPVRTLSRNLDYAISGLGAYRTYAKYPGVTFAGRALTCSTNGNGRSEGITREWSRSGGKRQKPKLIG